MVSVTLVMLMALVLVALMTFVLTTAAVRLVERERPVGVDALEELLGARLVARDEVLGVGPGEAGAEGEAADDDVGHGWTVRLGGEDGRLVMAGEKVGAA